MLNKKSECEEKKYCQADKTDYSAYLIHGGNYDGNAIENFPAAKNPWQVMKR